MMIDKRLIGTVGKSKKFIAINVLCQWLTLLSNIVMMTSISFLLSKLFEKSVTENNIIVTVCCIAGALAVRVICSIISSKMSYLSSKTVKSTLRHKIYNKLLKLGASYNEKVMTSEVVQVAVEGVDQLETYFGNYLPQFFYAMIAPITLFVALCFVNVPSAIILLICVPLIPIAIVAVQRWAKKLLSKYWGQYTTLGDTFLENLQGMTTLKIYQADEFKNDEMNREAENFRRITMKVLTMQLNSISVMDLVAYGGAAAGIITAVVQYANGNVTSLAGCLLIILLAADFFIPMRQLGSFFHIAMNGMAASGKIFKLLDLPEEDETNKKACPDGDISVKDLSFGYEPSRLVLKNVNLTFKKGDFTAIVGESGCGKSTLAALLMGRNKGYKGSLTVNGTELSEISESSLLKHITYISHNSYIFKGTVRSNLLMADPDADDEKLWGVLKEANLSDFLKTEQGLDTQILEGATNLSGGQRQRLALARALLHDSSVYVFDEATSNIDVESETAILEQIRELSKTKTVIMISHRLANVTEADNIYVLREGAVCEEGTHQKLLKENGAYASLWETQQSLENYGKDGDEE